MPIPSTSAPSSVAVGLGYAGLLPFVGLAAGSLQEGALAPSCTRALLAYGAVILSFVGALHWGFAMTIAQLDGRRRRARFLWSVVPSLLGWVALLLTPVTAALILIAGFAAQYGEDRRLARGTELPGWYLPLRLRLTVVACSCIAVGGYAASALPQAAAAESGPAAAAPAPLAAAANLYRTAPASADGIGKFYQGREIAQVMGFGGVDWLDRSGRDREERTDLLLEDLRLEPGMTVADIGAGSGYLSRRMAPRVAPGRVYAVDVQPQMVGLLTALSKQPGMGNVVPVLGSADTVGLPDGAVDLAVMVDVYHELEFPYEIMRSLLRALKPQGRVVLVEYRGEDPAVPIKALHKMSERQVRREMQPFPLVLERSSERLPLQHILVFRRR